LAARRLDAGHYGSSITGAKADAPDRFARYQYDWRSVNHRSSFPVRGFAAGIDASTIMGPDVPSKSRTKPAGERRDDLMNAAERLFIEHGVAATTVEQITSGAGVAKGSFYLHFTAKEDVVAGLRLRFADRIGDTIASAVGRVAEDDWSARLAAWVTGCAEGYAAFAPLHDTIFHDVPPPTRAGLADNPLIDDLTRLLVAGDAAGAWRLDDARFTAIFLFNALHGVILDPTEYGGSDELDRRVVDHCFRLVGLPKD
jgi:AcrR family transcriptional regulator